MLNRRAAVAVLPTLLALALRLYQLAAQPLWLDEVITHNRALLPLQQLVANSLINKHFPSYFLLVRAFDAPLIDEWTLRLPSVIFGSLAVLLVALIATEMRSPSAGLVAGMLMALSPIDVQFSQEARSYALVSFLILLALWGLLRIAKRAPAGPTTSDLLHRVRRRAVLSAWTAYALGTIAALNVLLVAAFWWLASNLAMAVVILRAGADRARLMRRWLVLQGVIGLIWLPGLIALAADKHPDPLRGYRWIPSSTFDHVATVLSSVYLFRPSDITSFALLPVPVPWLGFIVVAFALFGLWQLRREANLLAVIGFAAITMPAAMLALSTFHPFWIPRYLLWGTGAFYVLAGIGAAALPRRFFAWTVAVLIVGGAGNLAPYYRTETKPRWDLAAQYLATHARPGDAIATNDQPAKYVLSAYGTRYRLAPPILDGFKGAPALGAAQPPRVWVVYGRVGQIARISEADYLKKWSSLGTPAATVRFGRSVVAWRFERAPR